MFDHVRSRNFSLLFAIAGAAANSAFADVRYVAVSNASPVAPYTSWATAATNIQDAVDEATDGDTVLVGDGVYAAGGRSVYGTLTNRVAITKAVTVQSVNGPDVTVITGQGSGNGPMRCAYLTNGAVLAGFTLTHGSTLGSDADVYKEQAGGGAWCETGAVVSNCAFIGNGASYFGGGVYGGGTLNNCTLIGNTVGASGGGAFGGTLNNCLLSGNGSTQAGGACAATLSHCVVRGNSAFLRGGGVDECTLYGCLVYGNSSGIYGGGACASTLFNCTLTGNSVSPGVPFGFASGPDGKDGTPFASQSFAISGTKEGTPDSTDDGGWIGIGPRWGGGGAWGGTLVNCIVYGNFSGKGPNYGIDFGAPNVSMDHCCSSPLLPGGGNFDADPMFASTNDFHLQTNSPCINAGQNRDWMTGAVDLDGQPRILSDSVDMGAFEYGGPSVATPVFLPPAESWFTNALAVTLTCATEDSVIRFTLDGNEPSAASAIYAGPVALDNSATIKARAFKSGLANSATASAAYHAVIIVPPLIRTRLPTGNPDPVNEGTALVFSLTADDSSDPDMLGRGMSNVVWYVDGVKQQTTMAGAPNAITNRFIFRTNSTTVRGTALKDIEVKAVALDRQGITSETHWTVRVNNVPAAQVITFKPLPVKTLGDPDFQPSVTVSSGLPAAYASSDESVAKVLEGVIHIVGAGQTVITVSQQGDFDYSPKTAQQRLTVKALLSAAVPSSGGTVTGAGFYVPGTKVALAARPAPHNTFLHWEDGSQTTSRQFVMPNTNTTVSAWFMETTHVQPPAVGDPGMQRAMVGVSYTLPLAITSDSRPTVTVEGLPAGLSYSAQANAVVGIPRMPVTNRAVTVTAKNVNRIPAVQIIQMTVDPLPQWAQGSFDSAGETDELGLGRASMIVTPLGSATGKLALRGTNYSFSAVSYANRDESGVFWLTATAKVGTVSMPLTLAVATTGTLSRADGWLGNDGWVTLYRNAWKEADMAAMAASYAGYYTASLPGTNDYGSGYLLFTVDKSGGLKTTGKLADGEAVSLSGTLILDEDGRVWTVLYTSPTAYRDGGLFGIAEFFKPGESEKAVIRPLDEAPFVWENLSPFATQDYAAGFHRQPSIDGGWYDTVGNLYRFYVDKKLSVGTEGVPTPELLVGTNRYASVWWNPDGIALWAVTNSFGIMTGLTAPKMGFPTKTDTAYDYENPTNAVGLYVEMTRSTGMFRGSFKAWFDYGITHTSKTIPYEGVLTPGRLNTPNGIAGRGFFLFANRGQYLNAYNRIAPYNFNWSYDLKILLSE